MIRTHIHRFGENFKTKDLGIGVAMTVLLLCSAGVNALLLARVSSLKSRLEWETRVAIGAPAPPLEAHTLEGSPTRIEFRGVALPTVLYVLSPQCIWCTRNLDNIKAVEEVSRGKYRFIGLSLSDKLLDSYIARNSLPFPILKNPNERSVSDLRLRGTPITLVISNEGKVLRNWDGAFSGTQKSEVEEFFGIGLPGLKTETSAGLPR